MEVMHGTRFGMFAVSHILWSMVCSPFLSRLLGGGLAPAVAASLLMMLGYLLWGWLCSRFGHWPAPNRNQSLWAVFLPAGFAWAWAGTTAVCLYKEISIAAALGLPAFLLASPSLLFVMTFMGVVGEVFRLSGGVGSAANGRLVLGTAIFFAGLLPPLLFFLGSLLGSKKMREDKEPGAA